ncbi:MAG: hypothetical protein NTZ46_02740 [Verrucomicrobia bacterium]|nr:hypothetical protein [Verrucomicrobiota bacterium]
MKQWKARGMGAVAIWAGLALPLAAQAQGMALKPGCNYAIGFQDGAVPVAALPPVAANMNQRPVAVYRVLASAGDQQWYKIRMVARNPQGGWYTPPGSSDVWINLSYAMWVQEVLR